MLFIDAVMRFWNRVVNPQTFTDQLLHDAGHALTAVLVTFGLLTWVGLGLGLSLFLGWVIPVGLVEGIKDFNREEGFPGRDSLHDVATYLPAQAVYALLFVDLFVGIGFLAAIGSSFFQFYRRQFKDLWGKK